MLASAAIELADTSVWARLGKPGLEWFATAVEDGRIGVCDQVAMEVLYSARDGADFAATEEGLLGCPWYGIESVD
jgi:predicted nucleic acid-binding protein